MKPQMCTSSDAKALGGMRVSECQVDDSDQAQRVGSSQCSESLASHDDCDGATHVPSGCSSCQLKVHELHRMKKNGSIQLYCSACVLIDYKGMYCSQCFHVYAGPDQLGDPSLWLTCSKCHRFCHMECAQNAGLPTDSFFFTCQYCHFESSAAKIQQGNTFLKRPHTDDSWGLSGQETLAAAQIMSIFASKEAKEAKSRARACAAVAAKAAKVAKSALDVAYRAGLEEMRWRLEAHKQITVASPLYSSIRNLQKGPYVGDARSQQTAVALDDKLRQKMPIPPHYVGVAGNFFGNVSETSKLAAPANLYHNQQRVLSPVVSTDVHRSPFMSSHVVEKHSQQQSSTGLVGSWQHGSLPSFRKDQRFSRVSEGIELDALPESNLESSMFVGTPNSDSVAQCDTLRRNEVYAANTAELLSDDEAGDDLVDVGDLLAESSEKEAMVSSCLIDVNFAGLAKGTSVAKDSVEVGIVGKYSGQPPGTMLEVSSYNGTSCEAKVPASVAD